MCKKELVKNENVLLITMVGFMSEKESLEYIEEMKNSIKTINPNNYDIVVDSRKLNSVDYLFDMVGKIMELITSMPFKHIKVLC